MEIFKKDKITTPIAIIIAGLLIMIGIIVTGGIKINVKEKDQTPSGKVGANKEELVRCVQDFDRDGFLDKILGSAEKAMTNTPSDEIGTPYSIIIGPNNVMTEIRGAQPYEKIKELIEQVLSGQVEEPYSGELSLIEETDRIYGQAEAPIKIINYSDLECPHCSDFYNNLKKIVEEYNGQVSFVFRYFPRTENSFTKMMAAECVSSLLDEQSYWQYIDLIFGMLSQNQQTSLMEKI